MASTTTGTTTTTIQDSSNNIGNDDDDDGLDAWGWWRKTAAGDEAAPYSGFARGLDALAAVLAQQGPFDGVIGFSQGGAAAAMLASLLEPGRRQAFVRQRSCAACRRRGDGDGNGGGGDGGGDGDEGACCMDFPASFLAPAHAASAPASGDQGEGGEQVARGGSNAEEDERGDGSVEVAAAAAAALIHPPLKFAVIYSGFRAAPAAYAPFYAAPPPLGRTTRILHVIGRFDTVVAESRSLALVRACWAGQPHPDYHLADQNGNNRKEQSGSKMREQNVNKGRDGGAIHDTGNDNGAVSGDANATNENNAKSNVIYHPGGHFVPSQKVYLNRVADFIRECCIAATTTPATSAGAPGTSV